MALTVDRLEEFIVTLGSLVSSGVLDDVIAFGSDCKSISITKTASIQEFYNYMQQINCSSIGIKLSRKLRYERQIVLSHIVDFKLNNTSLVVTTYNGNYTDIKKYRF